MTKEILGNVTTDYSYTPLNRVTGITSSYPCFLSPDPKNRTTMVQYEYDAFGRRNSRTVYNGHEKHGKVEMKIETQTNHLYEGLGFNVLAEFENKKDNDRYRYDPKNNPTIEYLYAKGTVFSRNMFTEGKYRGNYLGMKVKDTAYYHQDPLGSTVMITDKKGHVEGRFSYDAFGSLYDDQTLPWGNDNWEQGGKHSASLPLYNGKRLDPVVGLYDYGYRDYLPQQMRFTTVDPIKPGPNWYAYVNNDPVNFIDPLGLDDVYLNYQRDIDTLSMLFVGRTASGGIDESRVVTKDYSVTNNVLTPEQRGNIPVTYDPDNNPATDNSYSYFPKKFPNSPKGGWDLSKSYTSSNPLVGTAIPTNANQDVPTLEEIKGNWEKSGTVNDAGYFIHAGNGCSTWGCLKGGEAEIKDLATYTDAAVISGGEAKLFTTGGKND